MTPDELAYFAHLALLTHLTVALKGLPENAGKSFEELANEALRCVRSCEVLLEDEARRLSWKRSGEAQPISDEEAALILMPKQKGSTRRLERLNEFKDYLKQHDDMLSAVDLRRMQAPWTKGLCGSEAMKQLFAEFGKIKRSEAQRAKKSRKGPKA
jgi:hypothetical protein